MPVAHSPLPHTSPRAVTGRGLVARAWWSMLLFPVSFVAAMVVGEGIPAWFGYDQPSLDTTPWWVILIAFTTAVVVFALPLLVVAHFGRAALAHDEPTGRLPIVVGLVVAGSFVALNLLSGVLQLILG